MKISTYFGNARSMAAIYSAGETGSQAFLLALIDNMWILYTTVSNPNNTQGVLSGTTAMYWGCKIGFLPEFYFYYGVNRIG